jgi:hypothetical protein
MVAIGQVQRMLLIAVGSLTIMFMMYSYHRQSLASSSSSKYHASASSSFSRDFVQPLERDPKR